MPVPSCAQSSQNSGYGVITAGSQPGRSAASAGSLTAPSTRLRAPSMTGGKVSPCSAARTASRTASSAAKASMVCWAGADSLIRPRLTGLIGQAGSFTMHSEPSVPNPSPSPVGLHTNGLTGHGSGVPSVNEGGGGSWAWACDASSTSPRRPGSRPDSSGETRASAVTANRSQRRQRRRRWERTVTASGLRAFGGGRSNPLDLRRCGSRGVGHGSPGTTDSMFRVFSAA